MQWKQRRPVNKSSPCIRTEEGYCDIKYTKSTFSISSGSSEEGDDCTEDYIIIPDNGRDNNRYCGSGLSNIVSKFRDNNNHGFVRLPRMGLRRLKIISFFFAAFQRPFEVLVNFDGADSATNRLQGFQLTFTQSTSSCV